MRMNELLKKRRKDIEKIGYFIHLPLFSFSKNNGQLIIDNGQFSPFVGAECFRPSLRSNGFLWENNGAQNRADSIRPYKHFIVNCQLSIVN